MTGQSPRTETLKFRVRSYEIGRDGTLLHGTIVNYLEALATHASAQAGYPDEWYQARGYLWLIRKWYLRFENPAYVEDELVGKTWISDMRRVQSHREYEIWRGETRIVRARANWVFIDSNRGRPARLFETFLDDYGPIQTNTPERFETRLQDGVSVAGGSVYSQIYRVRAYEIDRAQHVNNAHYLRWIEDAIAQSLQSLPIARGYRIIAHELEYRLPAEPGDTIEVHSTITATRDHIVEWQHKLRRANDNTVISSGFSLVYILDAAQIER